MTQIEIKKELSTTQAWTIVITISTIAIGFLFWLIYIKESPQTYPQYAKILPLTNAILNFCSTVCIVLGVSAIKNKLQKRHMTFMISAFAFSTAFLITYIIYHGMFGDGF